MRRLLKIIGRLALILAVYALQNAITILPYPLNHFNIIVAFLLWLMFFDEGGFFLWSLLILGFLTELFSSAPFGVNMTALFFGLLAADWCWRNFLTNRSLPSILLLSAIAATANSIAFALLNYLANLALRGPKINPIKLLAGFGPEILLTAALAAVGYLLASLFFKRLNPKYLSEKKI